MSSAEAYDAQMAHLKELLKLKAEIEGEMAEKLARLRKDYVLNSEAIESVVEHRLGQLK